MYIPLDYDDFEIIVSERRTSASAPHHSCFDLAGNKIKKTTQTGKPWHTLTNGLIRFTLSIFQLFLSLRQPATSPAVVS